MTAGFQTMTRELGGESISNYSDNDSLKLKEPNEIIPQPMKTPIKTPPSTLVFQH
jgi:hypothetical protein